MPVPERAGERRRTARVPVAGGRLEFPAAGGVQLLDISRVAVLLSSPRRVEPGDHVWLQAKLGEETVRLKVEVRRASPEEPSSPGPFVWVRDFCCSAKLAPA